MIRTGEQEGHGSPIAAGIFLGVGLGGFFDGIVLHQILQWHHMVSARYPPDSLAHLEANTLGDGLFHAATYVCVVIGVVLLWRAASLPHRRWSGLLLVGTILLGFGGFNVVEGLIDHEILGLHHVNETATRDQWLYWDLGFLAWGAAMVIAGWFLLRAGKRQSPGVGALSG
jgi:uncharacterized membrane protein